MRMRRVAVLLLFALWVLSLPACSSDADPACAAEPRVELRFLLLGNNPEAPAWLAWRDALTREGVPFDAVRSAEDALTRDVLLTACGHPRYQAVVQATNEGPVTLTAEEQATLDGYEDEFGIREVIAFGAPPGQVSEPLQDLSGTRLRVTPSGQRWWPDIVGEVPVTGAFGYLSRAVADLDPLLQDVNGRTVAATQRVGAHEELYVGFQSAPELLHFRFLSSGLIDWAANGARLGLRRSYLAAQVDDVFLPNHRWNPRSNTTDLDDAGVILMTASDVERAARWSEDNDFRLDLAANFGSADMSDLVGAFEEHEEAFGWINHTYQHLDLDEASEAQIREEIELNVSRAVTTGLELDDPRELVTGEHSGLENPALVPALAATGIRYVASDASRTPDTQRVGTAMTVPRHPINLYYNVGTREEQLDQYNYLYFEACEGDFCLDEPITWEGYVDTLRYQILQFVSGNDPRTLYVHQSNLAEDALLLDVLGAVLTEYRGIVSAPLVQPTLTESGTAMLRQRAWAAAVEAGEVTAHRVGGQLVIESERDLEVPVTGAGEEAYGAVKSGWVSVGAGEALTLDTVP